MMATFFSFPPSSSSSSLKWFSTKVGRGVGRRGATNAQAAWTTAATQQFREARRQRPQAVPRLDDDDDDGVSTIKDTSQQDTRKRLRRNVLESSPAAATGAFSSHLQSATELHRRNKTNRNSFETTALSALDSSKKGSAAALMSATSQHRRRHQRAQQQPRAAPGHIVNPSVDFSLPVGPAVVVETTSKDEVSDEEEGQGQRVEEEKQASSRLPIFLAAVIAAVAAIGSSGVVPF